jgi:prepilin-type processing-associated H-X9-DG protein
MEESALWDKWSTSFAQGDADAPAIPGLTCPSDPRENLAYPNLAYVGNAGQAFSDLKHVSTPADKENPADGVFVDDAKNPNIIANTAKDNRGDGNATNMKDYPRIGMSLSYISSNDGQSKTLMVSESLHTWYWTYGTAPATGGGTNNNAQDDLSTIQDAKHLFGFVWKNRFPANNADPIERVNGDKHYDKNLAPDTMEKFAVIGNSTPPLYEAYGYPCSNHPGGVNVGFCDGHGLYMADTVDPTIYGQLMTSNHNKSNLIDSAGVKPDKQMTQPSDSDL